VYRKCLLDTGSRGSQGNLISKTALKGIRCEIKKDAGREVCGLGLKTRLREFVTLRLRFWGKSEIFEVEFRILPTRTLLGFELGPRFDCLIGSEWMVAHPSTWVPRHWLEHVREGDED
jgi:hypothetical protein